MRLGLRPLTSVAVLGALLSLVPVQGQRLPSVTQAAGPYPPMSLLARLQDPQGPPGMEGGWIARTARAILQDEPLTGTMPVAIILALFADSPEPHISTDQIQQAMFDGPSAFGTVSEFYSEASGGRFTVTGQTTPWVRTSLTMAEVVGSEYGLGGDAQTGTYLLEAVAAADFLIDFTQFDSDGPDGVPNSGDDDGIADALAIQFIELAASCGGPSIWPHRSSLSGWTGGQPYESNDIGFDGTPILLGAYTTQGATDCGGVEAQNATTIAHELGHVLGLPDLYDRSQGLEPERRRWVVGCWSLMAAGSWGCGTEDREGWVRPTHFGPWEKDLLGWLSEVVFVEPGLDGSFTLEPVQTSGRVLKIPLEPDAPNPEYYLVEYRTQEGFDADLPSSGVLIYHIDPKIGGNRPCDTCPQLYRVGLVEADGNDSLRRTFLQGGNRGEPGDAWGFPGPGSLTSNTTPSSRLNSGEPSAVTVYSISIEDGVAHLNLSSRAIPTVSLLQAFLQTTSPPLTGDEESYLDSRGNGNGQFDVGDLRAYLRR